MTFKELFKPLSDFLDENTDNEDEKLHKLERIVKILFSTHTHQLICWFYKEFGFSEEFAKESLIKEQNELTKRHI